MKKFFRIFLIVVLVAVVIGTFVMLWNKSRPTTTEYELVSVIRGNIENISVATGKIEPRDEVLIKPQISGIISDLRKEAGDFVKEGEVIATVRVVPDMGSLNSAESRVNLAKISLQQAKTEYDRQTQLFERGVISNSEMEQAQVDYDKALEEMENAQSNLEIVRDGVSKRAVGMGNTQIRSTIDGMILDVPVKVGNSVILSNTFNDGTTIASVANMGDMLFVGKVDETEVGKVRAGMPMKVVVGAVGKSQFDAELEYISPKGVEENGAILFEIKAAATIPDTVTVRAGYSANAEIVVARSEDVLLVPESTLTFSGDSTYVYVVKDTLATTREYDKIYIETGLSDGINVEVVKGVMEGMKLRGNEVSKNR